MSRFPLVRVLRTAVFAALLALASTASAHEPEGGGPEALADAHPAQLDDVGIVEHVGQVVPLDTTLNDESGKPVQLSTFFTGQKPVFLFFVYHSCPTLCSMVQSSVTESLKDVPWDIGDKYEVLTISIDPKDTPQIASDKKATAVASYGRDATRTAKGWHFLTGSRDQIQKITDAVGFQFSWNERQQQFAHSAAVFVLTPTGNLARYLYGIAFPSNDVRLALFEASEGRPSVGAVEHFLLYCYQYDPNARGYVLQAWKVMRLGAAAGMLFLFAFIGSLWLTERRKKPPSSGSPSLQASIDREAVPPVTPS